MGFFVLSKLWDVISNFNYMERAGAKPASMSSDLNLCHNARNTQYTVDSSFLILNASFNLWGLDLSGSLQGAGGVGGLLKEATLYPTYDVNGNIMQKLDGTGTTVMAVDYDPFGNIISGSLVGEYGFSTKPLVDDLDWYYYGFRYYDPVTGRWPNRDPIEEWGGLNLYGLVGNNPVGYIDYLGLSWQMRCVRCRRPDGTWEMTCGLFNDETGETHAVQANDYEDYVDGERGNQTSVTDGDPYGVNGPLEPGGYDVVLDNSNYFGGDIPTVTNNDTGGVTTSRGTERSNIRIHPQRNISEGCITCADTGGGFPPAVLPGPIARTREDRRSPFVNELRDAIRESGGSVPLKIVDAGDCPCEE